MGLLDRDYYRDDQGGAFGNWFRHGRVTKVLVLAYVLLFLVQVATCTGRGMGATPNSGPVTESLSLSAEPVLKGQVWRLLTYGLLHTTDSLWYIAFNVVLLYFFGQALEERIGWRNFLIYFAASLILAGVTFVAATSFGLNGTNKQTMFIGATGGITALLVLFACQQPGYRLNLFFVIPVPIWVVIVLNVGVDAWMMVAERPAEDGRRVALVLHLGGTVMAILFFLRSLRFTGTGRRGTRVLSRSQPRLQIHREEEVEDEPYEPPVPITAAREADEHLEAQLDEVLAKVVKHGKDSLTPSEHAILKRAAETYRKRRK